MRWKEREEVSRERGVERDEVSRERRWRERGGVERGGSHLPSL